jgi:hypothetical protein
VLGADGLPEFGADLITALTHLNVHDFSHLVLALNARSIRSLGCCCEDADAGFLTSPLAPQAWSAAADWPAWRPALKLRVRNSTNSGFGGNALAPKALAHLLLSSNIFDHHAVLLNSGQGAQACKARCLVAEVVSDIGQQEGFVGTVLRSSPPLCSDRRMAGMGSAPREASVRGQEDKMRRRFIR